MSAHPTASLLFGVLLAISCAGAAWFGYTISAILGTGAASNVVAALAP